MSRFTGLPWPVRAALVGMVAGVVVGIPTGLLAALIVKIKEVIFP